MAKGSVRDTDKGYAALVKALEALAGERVAVLVGVRGADDSEMVVIAASNEFGTADGHVPERSYLRSTVDDGRGEIADDLQAAVTAAVDGGDLDRELGRLGAKWAGRVQIKMRDITDPPNAPATIAAKGVDNPLIDTGRLRQSITWVVERGDK